VLERARVQCDLDVLGFAQVQIAHLEEAMTALATQSLP
jgi:hypothetical protein